MLNKLIVSHYRKVIAFKKHPDFYINQQPKVNKIVETLKSFEDLLFEIIN